MALRVEGRRTQALSQLPGVRHSSFQLLAVRAEAVRSARAPTPGRTGEASSPCQRPDHSESLRACLEGDTLQLLPLFKVRRDSGFESNVYLFLGLMAWAR